MHSPTGTALAAAAVAGTIAVINATDLHAATINVGAETGQAYQTEFGIRADTGTRGYELAGATVTATLGDGSVETLTWEVITPFVSGGVNGDRWSLFKNELGFTSIDVLGGQSLTKLVIDASTSESVTPATGTSPEVVNGPSLFDVLPNDELLGQSGSTVGSSFGFPFRFTFGAPTGVVDVIYSGAVNVKGAAAVGDLFTTMTVDFTGLDGGAFSGSSVYETDMDTLAVAGDLAPVPLPTSLPLLLAGFGTLAFIRRKRT